MRLMCKPSLLLWSVALAASPALAQPYYARGSFNGWGTGNQLTHMGGGHYQGTVTGLTEGTYYEFKLANASWSENWPASNARFQADASGQATFHLWRTPAADGWSPVGTRVGYDDVGASWEVMGSFNGWGSPIVSLVSQGNGIYSATTTIGTQGSYEFKFRKAGDWGVSIGRDFGNSAPNISMGTTVPNQAARFDLDLPNGRYKVTLLGTNITFDGVLNSGEGQEWATVSASAVQDNYTGYGDQKVATIPSPGSELDALHVKAQGDRLYLGITGNLETNGNAIIIFFDTKSGGQNTLNGLTGLDGPGALPNMETDTFDSGFAADYVLAINNGAGRCDVDWYELSDVSGGTHTNRGHVALGSGSSVLLDGVNPNNLQVAFDNSNYAGVTNDSAAGAASAVTGVEASIALADLGLTGLPATISVQVVLVSGGGKVSGQSLAPMPAGTPDPGDGMWHDGAADPAGTPVDFKTIDGLQYATIALTEGAWSGTLDGRDIPSDFAGADATVLQQNPTSFGDQLPVQGVVPGSEIDKLLVKEDGFGNLLIGMTGNLSSDGTNLVIFLDTKPGGETTLTDHGGRLAGNVDDTLPCAMDYAILLNRGAGNIYVDWFDLTTNQTLYLGAISDNALLGGPLTGGDPPGEAWVLGANMGNLAGVSDNPADDPQAAAAATATTGFELLAPLSQIGQPQIGSRIRAMALLTGNGDERSISNQILPAGLGGGVEPFGAGPTDLAAAGYHCLDISLGSCQMPRYDADGDHDVDMDDFGRFQLCWTGDAPGSPEYPAYDPGQCACFDYGASGADGRIDSQDFASFVACASGSSVPADIHCAGQ